ncbi:hypothetical protein HDE_10158 [Halotydeus destructor]|nr:hypothetical protein HDE_10158 [Halotydeus destructor]
MNDAANSTFLLPKTSSPPKKPTRKVAINGSGEGERERNVTRRARDFGCGLRRKSRSCNDLTKALMKMDIGSNFGRGGFVSTPVSPMSKGSFRKVFDQQRKPFRF